MTREERLEAALSAARALATALAALDAGDGEKPARCPVCGFKGDNHICLPAEPLNGECFCGKPRSVCRHRMPFPPSPVVPEVKP